MDIEAVWFGIVSTMLALYVVLDGFDFGVGIVHRFVAHTDVERRTVLASIGPVWDGNEVWLIASGGVLFMSFPDVYATAFSGFYLALMILLWLLILRGIALEFRSQRDNPLWRDFWDAVFSLASGMLAFVFGAALGNLVRGVPLSEAGLAGMPLFTNFLPGRNAGLFDWYTILVGLFALLVLAGHGTLYLDWRTTGPVQDRARRLAERIWRGIIPAWIAVTIATACVQPEIFLNLFRRIWSIVFVIQTFAGLAGVFHYHRSQRPLGAFLSSSAFVSGLIATTMIGNYPYWLRSTIDPRFALTANQTVSSQYGLGIALFWWIGGMLLVAGYFTCLFRNIRNKVQIETDGGY